MELARRERGDVRGRRVRAAADDPPEQGLWCGDSHEPPLRVSGIQSGVFSGEVGSTTGQQPFRDGLVVRELQPAHWGWTPHYGLLEVRARMDLGPRSMASVWMVGIEDRPERSGEICIFEVFGDALEDGVAAVGLGCTRSAIRRSPTSSTRRGCRSMSPSRTSTPPTGGRPHRLPDRRPAVKTVHQAPDYPMQMMVAVFDFPAKGDSDHVPELAVDHVRGT